MPFLYSWAAAVICLYLKQISFVLCIGLMHNTNDLPPCQKERTGATESCFYGSVNYNEIISYWWWFYHQKQQ